MSNLSAWLEGEDLVDNALERRSALREAFPGVARVEFERSGEGGDAVTVDLGDDGLCLVSPVEPRVGESLRIELAGFVVEGYVRNVASAGHGYRVGVALG